MRRITTALIGAAVVAAVAAAGSSAAEAARPRATGAATRAVVALRQTSLGRVLVVGSGQLRGRTLYMFTTDTRSRSSCSGSCANTWKPLLTSGAPLARTGAQASKLATIRRGHARQVTYGGHPVYSYSGDSRAGQVNGESLKTFGGGWWALSSSGRAVKPKSSAPTQPPSDPYPYY